MSDYAPDKPLLPVLQDMMDRRTEAIRDLDPSHPMQCIQVLNADTKALLWIIGKLVSERDARLTGESAPTGVNK
jgi:hypothetical protein